MQLDFDLDKVEGDLQRRKAAPRAAQPQASPAYDFDGEVIAGEVYRPRVAALPLEANSTLRSVTVHRDRALVTRTLELTLPAGAGVVTFEGLPLSITEGLTASVESGVARIVSVETLSGSGKVGEGERTEAVRQRAEALVEQLGGVRDRIEALLAERQLLRAALVPPGATSGLPVSQVRAGLDFVSESERRISRELRGQQDAAEELAEELQPLLVKLDDPLATGQPIRVDLEVERAGTVVVALKYFVPDARWTPWYSARLEAASGRVELEVYGVVSQHTGEDWADASIELSTADPSNAPASSLELGPWTLGRSGGVGVYGALDNGAGAVTPAVLAPPAQGGVVETRLDASVSGRGAVVFAIPGKRTIRGDGSPQRLPVATQTLDAEVSLVTVPKVAPEVVRRASVRYDGELPLLPGPLSSFVGPDYVGSDAIAATVPGESLALAFGADERFRVTRQLVSRQQERVGRKATRYTFEFRIGVANHGAKDAVVRVEDQVPVSEDTRIEVRTLSADGATPGEGGRLSWDLPVAAGQSASIGLSFSVTVPDELQYIAADLQLMF